MIERAVLLESEDEILLEHLPLEISSRHRLRRMLGDGDAREGDRVRAAPAMGSARSGTSWRHLKHDEGEQDPRGADTTRISRQTLREKLKSYGIEDSEDLSGQTG